MNAFKPNTTHLDTLRMVHALELALLLCGIGAIIISTAH